MGILDQPSTAQLLFLGNFHLTPMTYNNRMMSHCPVIITVTFIGNEGSFPQGPDPKYHPVDRSSCQNRKIHHIDRLSLKTPSAPGFEQSIVLYAG